jgi:uncharacterized damage-inducible protein DinB
MSLAQSLIPEFDHEMAGTRKVLERVPLERFDWSPHPKSFPLGRLANHLAGIPRWGVVAVTAPEFDFANSGPAAAPATTREALLAGFDEKVAAARSAIAGAAEAAWAEPWTLRNGEHVVFTLPRAVVLRNLVLNHNVHHRGQMTVYLRLLDVPVPGLYGPSADES